MTATVDPSMLEARLAASAYLQSLNRTEPKALRALRARTAAMPFVADMQGAPILGQFLQCLMQLMGARRVLELGVFTGCTTLAMAMALPPDGTVVAVDVSERWPAIGREFWKRSGFADRIDLRIAPADQVVEQLLREGLAGSFDLAFIDANKDGYEHYFDLSLALLRQNGLMVFDNVFFGGRVQPDYTEARIRAEEARQPKSIQDCYVRYSEALKRFNQRIASDERVDVVVLPMLDGVTLARKV